MLGGRGHTPTTPHLATVQQGRNDLSLLPVLVLHICLPFHRVLVKEGREREKMMYMHYSVCTRLLHPLTLFLQSYSYLLPSPLPLPSLPLHTCTLTIPGSSQAGVMSSEEAGGVVFLPRANASTPPPPLCTLHTSTPSLPIAHRKPLMQTSWRWVESEDACAWQVAYLVSHSDNSLHVLRAK